MAATPYFTSQDIIDSVKRKISFPISQNTFTDDDILKFANEEMAIAQVPSVMSFHEEYFVFKAVVPFATNQNRYPVPERALGMKLRDLKWQDSNGNLFDMTRVAPEEKAYYQNNIGTSDTIDKYYMEGNDVILTPALISTQAVSLIFYYFLRPNQLVLNNRAAIIQNFINDITVINSSLSVGDFVTIKDQNITAVAGITISSNTAGAPTVITTATPHGLSSGNKITINGSTTSVPSLNGNYTVSVISPTTFSIPLTVSSPGTDGLLFLSNSQFLIGGSDIQTATNLTTTLNNSGLVTANNGSPSTSLVVVSFSSLNDSKNMSVSNAAGLMISTGTQTIQFNQVPSTYTDPNTFQVTPLYVGGSLVDFLQTKPGHKTKAIDILIPQNGISNNFITFNTTDIPTDVVQGDYICLSNECIIPQIPPDLHNSLAQRVASMILAALGDQQGLQNSMQKVAEMEQKQIVLLDNRVEGSPLKIAPKHSLLRYQSFGSRRRRF